MRLQYLQLPSNFQVKARSNEYTSIIYYAAAQGIKIYEVELTLSFELYSLDF
jgi:hypothetical protein